MSSYYERKKRKRKRERGRTNLKLKCFFSFINKLANYEIDLSYDKWSFFNKKICPFFSVYSKIPMRLAATVTRSWSGVEASVWSVDWWSAIIPISIKLSKNWIGRKETKKRICQVYWEFVCSCNVRASLNFCLSVQISKLARKNSHPKHFLEFLWARQSRAWICWLKALQCYN